MLSTMKYKWRWPTYHQEHNLQDHSPPSHDHHRVHDDVHDDDGDDGTPQYGEAWEGGWSYS